MTDLVVIPSFHAVVPAGKGPSSSTATTGSAGSVGAGLEGQRLEPARQLLKRNQSCH